MVKKVGNLIPNTFFITKGSGESDLEKHAGSYHMALYDAGISDFNIMTYSSVIPATAHLATMDELDLPHRGNYDRETLWNGVGRPLLRGFPSTGDRGISRVEYFL